MATQSFRIKYRYSIGWLIFWFIVFFPIGLVLFFTGFHLVAGDTEYVMNYHGSRGWLAFWTLAFFPVAIILFVINGASFDIRTKPLPPVIEEQ